MQENYLKSAKNQFEYAKKLGEKTFDQLNETELLWQYNSESNSIAIIVNHLWGNMKSRWTDFLSTDGEKSWRERDSEFETVISSRKELINKWDEGWKTVFDSLETVNKDNFDTEIFIRNQSHSMADAINRQLAHYAYHIGQIVYIGRMIKGDQWISLSIPKGKSAEYNQQKFSEGKHGAHFMDDIK